jgi:putative SOS response-associated peptidase YedK
MWRESAEWGPVYSGLMTDCNEAIRPVHNRMPVLLLPEDHDRWLRWTVSCPTDELNVASWLLVGLTLNLFTASRCYRGRL